jgi:hypothetical protein
VPWQPTKDVPFSSAFPFSGFLWDLRSRTVSLLETKQICYLAAIVEWRNSRMHTLRDAQRLYGKLLHTAHLVKEGRAYLTEFERMFPAFSEKPFMPRTFPTALLTDLQWWSDLLSHPPISAPIRGVVDVVELPAWSDASTSSGVAIVLGSQWRAWKLHPDWDAQRNRGIGWLEAVGFELLVRAILFSSFTSAHFRVFVDNQGVVDGWTNGCSRSRAVNDVFKRIHRTLAESSRCAYTSYVCSADNPADPPSRDCWLNTTSILSPVSIPSELHSIILELTTDDFAQPRAPATPLTHYTKPSTSSYNNAPIFVDTVDSISADFIHAFQHTNLV